MSDDRPAEPVVNEEQAWAKWQEVGNLIDVLARRADSLDGWKHAAGSSLAGDDRASQPYQVSHAVVQCLTAGVDHAQAVKSLVVDHGELHTAAPGSLSRGFIENIATAYWILHPSSRQERVARSMKWHVKNATDRRDAVRGLQANADTESERERVATRDQVRRMVSIARDIGVADLDYVRRGYRSSEAVEYADVAPGLRGLGVMFAWQMCSGFAHGRPWASLAMLDQEVQDTTDPGVVFIRLTNDLSRALYPVMIGMHLTQAVAQLHQQRAQPLYA
jgi:hypothetical protein